MSLSKEEQEKYDSYIDSIKTLYPDVAFRKQPESSLKALLKYENKYKINTQDIEEINLSKSWIFELGAESFTDIHQRPVKNKVIDRWKMEYLVFKMHGGNLDNINTQ